MTSLKTSIKTITYLSDTGCLEIQGASLIMLTLITAQNNERIMEVKTKEDWLYQFRRCSSRETLEKVISHTRYKLTPAEMEAFNSAVDHRLAELTMNKLYDRVPASVWKYVT